MISIDTNVLLRFVTRDDVVQFALVEKRLLELKRAGEDAMVTHVVLAEFAWTLRTNFK